MFDHFRRLFRRRHPDVRETRVGGCGNGVAAVRPERPARRPATDPTAGDRPTGERLVFVGGVPRSGTTLLQHVLDSHPAVFGGPEFDHVPTLAAAWRAVSGAWESGRIRAYCSPDQIDRAFARLVEDLLLPAGDACGARIVSEKTPFNVHHFIDVLELLPKCRAIHIVRDPRAVVSSLLRVGDRCRAKGVPAPEFAHDVRSAVRFTTTALAAGFRAAELFPDRVLTLTYEALVGQPEPTVRRVCAFVGLDFDPRLLEPHAVKHPAADDVAALDGGKWGDPSLASRPIEQSRVRAWEADLTATEGALVTAAFRDHADLRALGYRFNADGRTAHTRSSRAA
ncbi:MAG TPA: sulfotransferase [Gemmataceae bacterium]|jgi:hypothetical protein